MTLEEKVALALGDFDAVAHLFKHAVRDPVAAANAGLDIPGLGVTEGRTAEDFAAGLDQHPVPDEGRRPALASTPPTSPWRPGSPATAWSCWPTATACRRWTPRGVATGEREFGQVFDGPPLPVSGWTSRPATR